MKKILMLIFLGTAAVYGQRTGDLERQYREIHQTIMTEQNILDSLNRLMETTAANIEQEKKNPVPDQKKLVQWMAHGVTVTAQIREVQKRIADWQSKAESLRQSLEIHYAQFIDSLRRLERSENDRSRRQDIQDQIIQWTEKRIILSPAVKALAFDPQEVRRINLSDAGDPLERAMMSDYLKKALAEVNAQILQIATTRQEFESIAWLRKQAAEFVSESYEQGRLGTIARTQTYTVKTGQDPSSALGGEYTNVQARSVAGLIQQLNSGLRLSAVPFSGTALKQGLTEKEYLELLKQAEEQLKAYRDLVQKKLK